eukprot:14815476-Heterocapsa_arctica.AAC.1
MRENRGRERAMHDLLCTKANLRHMWEADGISSYQSTLSLLPYELIPDNSDGSNKRAYEALRRDNA